MNQKRLKQLLNYAPDTGIFIWLTRRGGARAGCVASNGYRKIGIDGAEYYAHRVAWVYVHGTFPAHDIDHIDGNRDNNKLCNLRAAKRAENQQNRGVHPKNTSGFAGVYYERRTNKWRAQITVNYTQKRLGRFNTPEAAYEAYLTAKASLHMFNPTVRSTS